MNKVLQRVWFGCFPLEAGGISSSNFLLCVWLTFNDGKLKSVDGKTSLCIFFFFFVQFFSIQILMEHSGMEKARKLLVCTQITGFLSLYFHQICKNKLNMTQIVMLDKRETRLREKQRLMKN